MQIKNFIILSTITVLILGTILHFTYEWFGNNEIVGLFSATNESTWEHLKLIFFPMLLVTIIGYFTVGENISCYWCARTISVIISMLLTIIIFYTYEGVLGYNIGWVNILIFVVAVIIGEFVSYKLLNSVPVCGWKVPIVVLAVFTVLFFVFTQNPPEIGLFESPEEEEVREKDLSDVKE